MERVLNLLKGSYWVINLKNFKLSDFELDFLKIFFDIVNDHDFENLQEYLILRKKQKFLPLTF